MPAILDDPTPSQLADTQVRLERLTAREREIVQQLVAGQTSHDTAVSLGISSRTVELHRQHIIEKLGTRNIVQAIGLIAMAERPRTLP